MGTIKNICLSIIVLIIVLLLCEIGLRIAGYNKIDEQVDPYFVVKDSLKIDYFEVDKDGVFHLNQHAANLVARLINDTTISLPDLYHNDKDIVIPYLILSYSPTMRKKCENGTLFDGIADEEFKYFFQQIECNYPYRRFIDSLKSIPTRDEFQNGLIKQYELMPINEHGFRTVSFDSLTKIGKRKRVLFIGDSFTFGCFATPLSNSFCDYLNIDGRFEVIDLGIPGSDPTQYLSVAQKYCALLKPDYTFVMVNFESDNDLPNYRRAIGPDSWSIYPTNAGWLHPFTEDGRLLPTAQIAYDYWYRKNFSRFRNNPLTHTAVGSAVIRGISKLNEEREPTGQPISHEKSIQNLNSILKEIKMVANNNGSYMMAVALPIYSDTTYKSMPAAAAFNGIPYSYMPNIELMDFSFSKMHLNSSGNRKMAEWIKQEILLSTKNRNKDGL